MNLTATISLAKSNPKSNGNYSPVITVYFLNSIWSVEDNAEWLGGARRASPGSKLTGTIVLADGRTSTTFAHEIGHAFSLDHVVNAKQDLKGPMNNFVAFSSVTSAPAFDNNLMKRTASGVRPFLTSDQAERSRRYITEKLSKTNPKLLTFNED